MAESRPTRDTVPPSAGSIDPSLYEAVFHNSLDGILIADDDARYIDVNAAACEIVGRTRKELIGERVGTFVEHPSDAQVLWEKAKQSGTIRAEIAVLRPDGQKRYIEFTAVANFVPGRHLILVRDFTHRRNLDEQIRNASKMEAIGRLAGGVAHDFNNLLMVITSYTELMLDSMADFDPLRKKAQEVLKASARAASLTRQLLAFSRKQVLDPQFQDFNILLREMSKLLGRVLGENVEVKLDLRENLGSVYADRGQIEQIMMHLAVNARDVMPEGGRFTVRTANVDFDGSYSRLPGSPPPGEFVMMSVEDTGNGMSRDVLSHLFEPFFSTKAMGKGTGLGLAAVYGIVKQSGGFIWVDSEEGHGSRFKMYFPRAVQGKEEQLGRRASFIPETRPAVVLLVEDEEALRAAAGDFLETRGYKIMTARDGTEALSMASKFAERIDVLITDLVMPGISGRVLAQELVKIHPETKVMYMSGYDDETVMVNGEIDSSSAFLRKPFRMDALSAKIREVLGEESRSSGSGPT
ncbi:PAS/PAC sensor hybrid histidine kinase [Candidatus Koribacter versatilis Ellin345]|uniref:histidine kinase n=1 Tax=Koribacter versatilis (strain Ellin345) TaxID=204669 RepID=Q1IM81_KORVE|nr:PAS domain-containing hybrid sensor histidine kinase/response regulator [Candidatus Koribacter versatilis]ABF42019.1 PAS/PAC sensor hybrid histidine kinase [Candidatus Koribacter versatilis Ellin345]